MASTFLACSGFYFSQPLAVLPACRPRYNLPNGLRRKTANCGRTGRRPFSTLARRGGGCRFFALMPGGHFLSLPPKKGSKEKCLQPVSPCQRPAVQAGRLKSKPTLSGVFSRSDKWVRHGRPGNTVFEGSQRKRCEVQTDSRQLLCLLSCLHKKVSASPGKRIRATAASL